MFIYDTGDWHLGVGAHKDTCVISWIKAVIDDYAQDTDAHSIILGGDIHEWWKDSIYDTLKYNIHIYNKLALVQSMKQGSIIYIRGNHDSNKSCEHIRKLMYDVGLGGIKVVDSYEVAGWRFTHGNEFDFFCKSGPLSKFSRVATWTAGLIETALPFVKDSWLDPTSWISAANIANKREIPIQRQAELYAEQNKINIGIHHTHYAHFHVQPNWGVINPGGLTEGHELSYIKLNTVNGQPTLVRRS